MRTNEITCNLSHPDFPDDITFVVRELLVSECKEIMATTEEDPIGCTLRDVVDGANLDIRHRVEVISRATLNPPLEHGAAILIARHSRATLQSLSDMILELTSQAIGFESVAALHTIH